MVDVKAIANIVGAFLSLIRCRTAEIAFMFGAPRSVLLRRVSRHCKAGVRNGQYTSDREAMKNE
jgi:hypothetical protein